MRQKHEGLFEHFSGTFPENYIFFRENKNKNNFLKENEALNSLFKKISNATIKQPNGD